MFKYLYLKYIFVCFAVSLKSFVQPTCKNVWNVTKSAVANTKAKPLVTNRLVGGIENKIGSVNDNLISKLERLRDKQYKQELAYLEKEIQKVKRRISGRSRKRRF